jgi:NAD-dependent SIR2 family protein deacetylase
MAARRAGTGVSSRAPMETPDNAALARAAAEEIAGAHALVIGAGAGMGVDSGLPDFRGDKGFWRAYPAYEKLGLGFMSMANPRWFRSDPALAWGFYGHRLELYRATRPHRGFDLLLAWSRRLPGGAFVFTSNVDGQFQRAGFHPDRVVEAHGAIDWMQCTLDCGAGLFPADPFRVAVDPATFRASPPLPACPRCGALARPNILMFGDGGWDGSRTEQQEARLAAFLASAGGKKLVVIELGAGGAVPTVRLFCERTARSAGARLVRVNPREPGAPAGSIAWPAGALTALEAIDGALGGLQRTDPG